MGNSIRLLLNLDESSLAFSSGLKMLPYMINLSNIELTENQLIFELLLILFSHGSLLFIDWVQHTATFGMYTTEHYFHS